MWGVIDKTRSNRLFLSLEHTESCSGCEPAMAFCLVHNHWLSGRPCRLSEILSLSQVEGPVSQSRLASDLQMALLALWAVACSLFGSGLRCLAIAMENYKLSHRSWENWSAKLNISQMGIYFLIIGMLKALIWAISYNFTLHVETSQKSLFNKSFIAIDGYSPL